MTEKTLTFLLTERRRFAGQKFSDAVAKILGQADKLPTLSEGEQEQLGRHVSILPRAWPLAAITRQLDADDAHLNAWLRADPAHVRAEMGVVRLLACGDLGLTQADADELIKPLKILFGDIGFPLSAPHPARWYLSIPKESKLPVFVSPDVAIGSDIFSQFPNDDSFKRWRTLLNEAQITLHNHPLNAERLQKGLLPVNSLYFWGGGVLPDQVKFHAEQVVSNDNVMQSLMHHAGVKTGSDDSGSALVDCRELRNWSAFENEYFLPALDQLKEKKYARIVLDFSDGASFEIKTSQKWRFWRGVLQELL